MPNGSVSSCGKGSRQDSNEEAFTLIDLLVAVALLLVVSALLLPAVASRPSSKAPRITCTCHLKQVGLAFQQWALDNGDQFPMQVSVTNGGSMDLVDRGSAWVHFSILSNELNTPKVLFCPAEHKKKKLEANSFAPNSPATAIPFTNDNNLSYFVGVDANRTNCSMFLAGDRNLTNSLNQKRGLMIFPTNQPAGWTEELHKFCGNVGLADGSVQQFSTSRVKIALIETGDPTNRLAMP